MAPLATAFVLITLAATAVTSGNRLLLFVLPVCSVLWMLLLLDRGYLVGREHRHRVRRRVSDAERSDWLPGPATRAPSDFPGAPEMTPELHRALGDPVDHQGRLRARGVRLAATPLLAVSALSFQTIFLPGGGSVAVGLAAAECAVLVVMLAMIWSDRRPTGAWVTSRMRRELLRRETFLIVAGIGPYLAAGDADVERIKEARVALLARSGHDGFRSFVALSELDARGVEHQWIDRTWQAGPGPSTPDAAQRMQTYLEHRIRKQILFFTLGAEKCTRTEQHLSALAKSTVLAATVVAIAYCTVLAAGDSPDRRQASWFLAVLALLSATFPALCNGVLALQNLYSSQRLAISYLETRDELLRHHNTLREIMSTPDAPDSGTRFRALAIHVETTLTRELLRWSTLIDRSEFDPAM